jgi:hypothetical protein
MSAVVAGTHVKTFAARVASASAYAAAAPVAAS